MSAIGPDPSPFLAGNFAPWRPEGRHDALPVVGTLPRELNGTYYRNGPNPAFDPPGRYHWFEGDGMLHAITLRDGRASYANRYVESAGLLEERRAGRTLYPSLLDLGAGEAPRFKNTGNTNIVFHAGRLLALMEAALPTQIRPDTLATVGEFDFGSRLQGSMTAHPKLDPVTGEMLFFGYSPVPPYLQYYVVAADGTLTRHEVIDVAWPSMMHDFAVTADYVVFILCPLLFSFENMAARGGAFSWEPERGTRLGVMPRAGTGADVRWFDTEACYVFHPLNAYAADDEIVLDVARYPHLRFMTPREERETQFEENSAAKLHRWRLALRTGTVRSDPLDDRAVEFPRADERRLGRPHRYGYLAATGPEGAADGMPVFTALHKYDLVRGRCDVRAFGPGNGAGEPLFIPRHADAAEDDGWVVTVVYDQARDASDFVVLDARDIAGEPVATVRLPHRVPYGFHGNWVSA